MIGYNYVRCRHFDTLTDLTRELHDYVHLFNHIRIYGALGYLTPIQYNLEHFKKVV
ncbi:IS3 family transposase [Bacillus sp. OTU2372]|uniref:IS3 family transposase n=1 Tax=Bacillus sp. OTU2372 TaxID=3043858 RepID=UPI00313E0E43